MGIKYNLKMRKVLKLFLILLFLITNIIYVVNAFPNEGSVLSFYKINFESEVPNSIKLIGGDCSDNNCGSVSGSLDIYYYKLIVENCVDFYNSGDAEGLSQCIENYKIPNNILYTSDQNNYGDDDNLYLVVRTQPSSFGSLFYLFTEGDSYIPIYEKLDLSCDYQYCVYPNVIDVNFEKIPQAKAEVTQLNIINTEDSTRPVQVTVPVKVDEGVCSAYRLSHPNYWRPNPPSGYSDFSMDTSISLKVIDTQTNEVLYSPNSIHLPILADTCANTGAFQWTPDSSLENRDVEFRVTTHVIDNQVINKLTDTASSFQTIYPIDLTGSCWVNVQDFSLSNQPSDDLTTGDVQVTIGEPLYANFKAVALEGNDEIPISFSAQLKINGETYLSRIYSSGSDYSSYHIEIEDFTLTHQPGDYNVELILNPVSSTCTNSHSTTQTQEFTLIDIDKVSAEFYISNEESEPVISNITLRLLQTRDEYITDYQYENTLTTDSNGHIVFEDLVPGIYSVRIRSDEYKTLEEIIEIFSDTTFYKVLEKENTPPYINLPNNFTEYYRNPIEINLRDYIRDINQNFDSLNINYNIENIDISSSYNNGILTLSASHPLVSNLIINVEDDEGESSSDITTIYFVNNHPPNIEFNVNPIEGYSPLSVTFNIIVNDPENDPLTCRLEFGNGDVNESNCDDFRNFNYVYHDLGNHFAKLIVTDGYHEVEEVKEIIVYEETSNHPPVINVENITATVGELYEQQVTYTDEDGDNVIFSDNCPFFDITSGGLISFTPSEDEVGIYYCNIIGDDGADEVLVPIKITIEENIQNHPPIINVENITATVGELYEQQVTYTDEDGDNVIFNDTCSLFDISSSGLISFTPTENEIGTYYCNIIADDGRDQVSVPIKVTVEGLNHPPIINVENITATVGELYEQQITYTDEDGDNVIFSDTCSLFDISSSGLISFTPTENEVGTYYCDIIADDGRYQVRAPIKVTVEGLNHPPIINLENITAIVGELYEQQVTYTDEDGDNVIFSDTCSLFNISSSGLISFTPTENEVGTYYCDIIADDGRDQTSKNIIVFVINDTSVLPVANITNNNIIAYQGEIFNIDASNSYDPNSLSITRYELEYKGRKTIYNNPNLNYVINEPGNQTLKLYVVNEIGLRSLPYEFNVNILSTFSEENTRLIIDDKIYSGDFNIKVETNNETLIKRSIKIKPYFIIDGVINKLDTYDNYLDSRFITSKYNGDTKIYEFKLNTNDFVLRIPVDKTVEFVVELVDEFGTSVKLSKNVIVTLPEREELMTSVSGSSQEVIETLKTSLKTLNKGYNNLNFKLVNNEDSSEKVSLTVTSNQLNIYYKRDIVLGSGEVRDVNIPIYVSRSGSNYPVRISVSNGKEKSTQYTFVNVE